MKAVLDHGGPLLLWDATVDASGPRTGLSLHVDFCTTPDCRWAHVALAEVEETDDPTNRLRPREPMCDVSIHVDSGEIRVERAPGEEAPETELVDRLTARLEYGDGTLVRVLQKRWRHAKKATQSDWRVRDWTSWEPGLMVPWQNVYPDDPNLLFVSNGETYWADDMYCITAGCSCRDTVIAFFRTQDCAEEPLCDVTVDLRRWTISNAEDRGAPTDLQKRLWADLQRDAPYAREEMNRRHAELLRIAPEIRALSGTAPTPVRRSGPRPGRNDPCPCGSGRKYKKCCLGKEPPVA